MSFRQWLQSRWYGRGLSLQLLPLVPVWGLFCLLSGARRLLYACRLLRAERLPVPVLVVGNITVGGAGKTPLTLWLAEALRRQGWQPAIVSRGYGAQNDGVRAVTPDSVASDVGDEPLLLARRSGVPVWVGRQRAVVGRALLQAHPEVNVLLCDDGLQHYALARDVEIAVFDLRAAGNGWRLPLGPLREPPNRLARVDAVVLNGLARDALPVFSAPGYAMRLRPGSFYRLSDPGLTCQAAALSGRNLHALAGIGDPERFFATLGSLGLVFDRHPFPDHHAYSAADLAFAEGGVLLMTEKDAVKCAGLITGDAWVLPVEAEVDAALMETILEKIRGRKVA